MQHHKTSGKSLDEYNSDLGATRFNRSEYYFEVHTLLVCTELSERERKTQTEQKNAKQKQTQKKSAKVSANSKEKGKRERKHNYI